MLPDDWLKSLLVDESVPVPTYTYDDALRLIRAKGSHPERYTYDAAGNLTGISTDHRDTSVINSIRYGPWGRVVTNTTPTAT